MRKELQQIKEYEKLEKKLQKQIHVNEILLQDIAGLKRQYQVLQMNYDKLVRFKGEKMLRSILESYPQCDHRGNK